MKFKAVGFGRWKFSEPVTMDIKDDELGGVCIYCPELDLYAGGDNVAEAWGDLCDEMDMALNEYLYVSEDEVERMDSVAKGYHDTLSRYMS